MQVVLQVIVDIYVKITCAHCHREVLNTAPAPVVSEKARYYPFTLILVYLVMMMGVGHRGIESVWHAELETFHF